MYIFNGYNCLQDDADLSVGHDPLPDDPGEAQGHEPARGNRDDRAKNELPWGFFFLVRSKKIVYRGYAQNKKYRLKTFEH